MVALVKSPTRRGFSNVRRSGDLHFVSGNDNLSLQIWIVSLMVEDSPKMGDQADLLCPYRLLNFALSSLRRFRKAVATFKKSESVSVPSTFSLSSCFSCRNDNRKLTTCANRILTTPSGERERVMGASPS